MHHAAAGAGGGAVTAVVMALLMAACMAPLLAGPWSTVAQRNLRPRRALSLGWFSVGFLTFWLLVSAAAYGILHGVGAAGSAPGFALACVVAAWWQWSARRLRLADRCTYVRAGRLHGWGWAIDHLRAGWQFALTCGRTCWAAMVAMLLAPTVLWMCVVAAAMLYEFRPGPNPFPSSRRGAPAVGFVLVALASAAIAATAR